METRNTTDELLNQLSGTLWRDNAQIAVHPDSWVSGDWTLAFFPSKWTPERRLSHIPASASDLQVLHLWEGRQLCKVWQWLLDFVIVSLQQPAACFSVSNTSTCMLMYFNVLTQIVSVYLVNCLMSCVNAPSLSDVPGGQSTLVQSAGLLLDGWEDNIELFKRPFYFIKVTRRCAHRESGCTYFTALSIQYEWCSFGGICSRVSQGCTSAHSFHSILLYISAWIRCENLLRPFSFLAHCPPVFFMFNYIKTNIHIK